MAGCLLGLCGCGRQETPAASAPHPEAAAAAPAASPGLASAAPLFAPGKLTSNLLAARTDKDHPALVIDKLNDIGPITFDQHGAMLILAEMKLADPDAGPGSHVIEIDSDKKWGVRATTPSQGSALGDDGARHENYNHFGPLAASPDGSVLTLFGGTTPASIDGQGKIDMIPLGIPPAGPTLHTFEEFARDLPNANDWLFDGIAVDQQAMIYLHRSYAEGKKQDEWFQFKAGAMLQKVADKGQLPLDVQARIRGDGAELGPDGYLYRIDPVPQSENHFQLVRIGDAGKSSFRKAATVVPLMALPPGVSRRSRVSDFEISQPGLAISPGGRLVVYGPDQIFDIQTSP